MLTLAYYCSSLFRSLFLRQLFSLSTYKHTQSLIHLSAALCGYLPLGCKSPCIFLPNWSFITAQITVSLYNTLHKSHKLTLRGRTVRIEVRFRLSDNLKLSVESLFALFLSVKIQKLKLDIVISWNESAFHREP